MLVLLEGGVVALVCEASAVCDAMTSGDVHRSPYRVRDIHLGGSSLPLVTRVTRCALRHSWSLGLQPMPCCRTEQEQVAAEAAAALVKSKSCDRAERMAH